MCRLEVTEVLVDVDITYQVTPLRLTDQPNWLETVTLATAEGTSRAREDIFRDTKNLFDEALAGKITHEECNQIFQMYTEVQQEYAIIDIVSRGDLCRVFRYLSNQLIKQRGIEIFAKLCIRSLFEGNTPREVGGRACASAAADVIVLQMSGRLMKRTGPLINCAAVAILVILELYRWSTGVITESDFTFNTWEHICGGIGGTVGSLVGSIFGCPGSVVGGLIGDLGFRYLYHVMSRADAEKMQEALVKDAAARLGINLPADRYEQAKTKFRVLLLTHHPDRVRPVSEEARKECDETMGGYIADWQIVRNHYLAQTHLSGSEDPCIKVNVMKIWDATKKLWVFKRMWVGNLTSCPSEQAQPEQQIQVVEENLYI